MPDWRDACARHADDRGISEEVLRLLDAFGPSRPACPDEPFATLLNDAETQRESRTQRIVTTLSAEVDADQAQMFGRRFQGVDGLLFGLATDLPDADVLRVGLHQRTDDILAAPGPHALRIRALVDFYTSQAAVLHHTRHSPVVSLADAAADARWRTVARGVVHGLIEGPGPRGPLHVNVLVAEGARLRALNLQTRGTGLIDAALDHGAIAGVSGGFFLYSEPDITPPSRRKDPVGLLVSDGEVVNPPTFPRAAIVQAADGSVRIQRVSLTDWVLSDRVSALRVLFVGPPDAEIPAGQEWAVVAVSRATAERVPADGTQHVVVVGTQVVSVGPGPTDVPLNGVVLRVPTSGHLPLPGPITWLPPVSLRDAIAGGPALIAPRALNLAVEGFASTAPPITFSRDETYDQNLLPRMAAGLREDGSVVFVAVDGRNFDRAPGLTLRMTADLCRELGCVSAMNLDGGSSKRMVVEGKVVDLPTTDVVLPGATPGEVRPVHTAILVIPSG